MGVGDANPVGNGHALRWLGLWLALTIALQGALWATGFRAAALAEGVERGAARAESARVAEVGDDLVRKAVKLQESTLPFWTILAAIGDFVVEPLALVMRALLAAVLLGGLAALVGRPPGFERALADNAGAQGFWVLGLAVRVALMIALKRGDVELSPTLALPPGVYPATWVVGLRQLDPFALLGWSAMARGAWGRGQANLAVAGLVCGLLWAAEAAVWVTFTLVFEAGMRLSLIPE